VDVLLGVSMDSTEIRMVLVEGENADGATVDEGNFHTNTPDPDNPATSGTGSQVLSAILGTREGAAEGGYALASTGVVWSDPTEAAALRDALAAYKVENVMLVSAFVAAAALAQAVGHETGCGRIAMLLVEPDSATLGVVDSDDGSVTVVSTELLDFSRLAGELAAGLDADTVAHLADMVTSCDTVQTRPESLFVVGHGIDIARLKPALEAMTPLRVSTPEDPETALARGAALASAKAPLFTSTTAALAYSQDPGTDRVDRYLIIPDASDVGSEPVAYSLVLDPDTVTESDTETGAHTEIILNSAVDGGPDKTRRPRSPLLLVGSTLAAVIVIALVALELALAVNIRTTVALQPSPQQNLIVPTEAPAPAPTVRAAIPAAQHAPSVPNRVVAAPAIPAPAASVPAAKPAIPAPTAPVPAAVPAPADPLPVLFPFPAVGAIPAPPPPVVAPPVSAEFFPNLLLTATPPAQVPAPAAAVQVPAPAAAVQVPLPAAPKAPVQAQVQLPKPQVPLPAAPKAPVQAQVQLPKPQMPLPAAPKAPVQLPAPQVQVPKPPMPAAPAPALQLPALQLPLPKAPTAPGAPAAPAARR
jgi:hypothetical protein